MLGLRVYKKIHRADDQTLARLRSASVGEVSDVLHGMGVMDAGIQGIYAPMDRLFGSALTADVSPGDGFLMRPAIDVAQPGDVLIVNSHGATARAVIGGGVGVQMVHRGIKGMIVDGAVRDVAEFVALKLPVMARAVSPRSGTSREGWGEVNVPIACGGVVVNPGDVIIGDPEGVVVVPRARAAAVADALGKMGHSPYQPEKILAKLASIAPGSAPQWREKVDKSLAERGATIIDGYYDDGLR